MANIIPQGRDASTGRVIPFKDSDVLVTEAGSPLTGGFASSYAFFNADTISTTTIQWAKVTGTSDITVSSGTITVGTAGVYEIYICLTSSTSASTKDMALEIPATSVVARATENQGTGGGSQSIVYMNSFSASDTFIVTLSAGFNTNILENMLSIKRVA